MEPSQNQISLKMIPRIDFDRIKARMSLVGLGLGGELCRRAGGPLAQPAAPLPPPLAEGLVCQAQEVQAAPPAAF